MLDTVAPASRPLKIGYVLKRFPRLSETFVLNEILEMERSGVEVEIFSLLRPLDHEPVHEDVQRVLAPVTYLPNGSALRGWKARTPSQDGGLEKSPVTELFDQGSLPFAELMPGKTVSEACQIMLKATTLAMLATARGIMHLHVHFTSDATTTALLASRISGIGYSFTAHARDIYHTYVDPAADTDLRRRKIAEADFVATVSEYNRRHLVGLAGQESTARIHRVYNGVDLDNIRPPEKARETNLVIGVGRLIEKKGFSDLVEACRILGSEGYDFRCRIIGEGPGRQALEQQIREAGLGGCIRLLGAMPQKQVLEMMQRATVMVLPCVVSKSGDRDGLPTVLLEALASGLPAISTRVVGVPEIIEHERSGLLAEPNDPTDLATQMARVLSEPVLRWRLSDGGRSKAEDCFDLSTNVGVLRQHIENVSAITDPMDSELVRRTA